MVDKGKGTSASASASASASGLSRSRRDSTKHTAEVKPHDLLSFIFRRQLSKQERETAGWWTATVCIGLLVGVSEYVLTVILALSNTWRYATIQKVIDNHSLQLAGLFCVVTSSVLVLGAAALTVFVSPMASGSGLPEMKGFLNANRIPGLFRLSTFVVRAVGVCMCLIAGLPLGREGPMVHIGGCIGHWIANVYHRTLGKKVAREKHTFPAVEEEISKDIKRLFVTLGGAAGIAAAFKAPVGGVLYMFEELASFWSPETTFRAFVCTTVAAIGLSALLSQGNAVAYDKVVVYFDSSKSDGSTEWHFVDLLPTLIISVLCGVAASVFTKGFLVLMKLRRSSKMHKKHVWVKILDAAFMGLFVAMWKFGFSDFFKCKTDPVIEGEEFYRYKCPAGEYNHYASLALTGTEGALKLLFVRGAPNGFLSSGSLAGLFFTVMVFGCSIAGLPIPMGLFMPNMLMGATLGRLCGQCAHSMGIVGLADPGVFALIGAGAMLGAFTRMTVTVAVLLVEATGDLTILAPMMLGISVAKLVAQSLVHHLDHVLLGMKAIPYLETDTPDSLAGKKAGDIVVRVPTVFERSSITLLQKVLGDAPSCEAFPVVNSYGKLRGLVRREALKHALDLMNAESVAHMRKLYDEHVISIPDSPKQATQSGTQFGYLSDAESHYDPAVSDAGDSEHAGPGGSPGSLSSTGSGSPTKQNPLPKGLKYDPRRKGSSSDTFPLHAEDGSMGVAVHYYMDSTPYAVVVELPLRRVYPLFRKLNLQQVVVIDGDARVSGIIGRSDLLRAQHEAEEEHGHGYGWLQGYLMYRKQRKAHRFSHAPSLAHSHGKGPDEHKASHKPNTSSLGDTTMLLSTGTSSLADTNALRAPRESELTSFSPEKPAHLGIMGNEPISPSMHDVLRYENSFTYKQQKAADARLGDLRDLFSGLLANNAKDSLEKVDPDDADEKVPDHK